MCEDRYKTVKRVLWIILFANFLVTVMKICIGYSCKSQSAIADGIHSLADGASNIVGLVGIWLASKPRDEKHQYGHGKYEIVASLFIGAMLAVMSVRIMSRAVMTIKNPIAPDISFIEVVLMIATVIINTVVAVTEYRCGRKLDSTILVTDSLHTRGDIFISCTVLLGLVGIRLGLPACADGIMSILVAIAVLISAGQIIKNCIDVLVDSAVVDGDEVRSLLMTIPGVYDVHQVRSRGENSHVFIDLHVIVSPQESVVYTHRLSHRLEETLKEHFGETTEVNIHIEPNDGRHDTE